MDPELVQRQQVCVKELTMAKALRQMALVRLARMAMPTLVQPRLMRCRLTPAQ